ncbi:hypothetical protein N9850_02135 [Granulosicoccus sp.]|nr:hypothetical protein [Granulosicoccus sp.]MDB4222543.1 hypothetical protein [Granulosicoccus sp.]
MAETSLQEAGRDIATADRLRNDEESFNKVRKLSPTSHRFRVFDADGRDIRTSHHTQTCKAETPSKPDSQIPLKPAHHYGLGPNRSTRVECAEPKPGYYLFRKTGNSNGGAHGFR